MTDAKNCRTCTHWAEAAQAALYPTADPNFGNCLAIPSASSDTTPEADVLAIAAETSGLGTGWLETRADFGCILHRA